MGPGRREGRGARVGRAFAAITAATILAASAHTLGGGGAPPAWIIALVIALGLPLAAVLAGRRLTLTRTSLLVLLAQGLLHVAFASVGTADLSAHLTHVHHGSLEWAASSGIAATPAMPWHHLLAAVITVVLVRHADALLRRIRAGLQRLLRARIPRLLTSHRVPAALSFPRRTPRRIVTTPLSLRGPPAGCA